MTTYTNREVIERMLDVMRRADPDYVKAHGLTPCMDPEWDMAIQAAEDHLEEMDVGNIPVVPQGPNSAKYIEALNLLLKHLQETGQVGAVDGTQAAALASIPHVGPALAAAAYAETMALVMSGLGVAAASGGFDIPKDPKE